jgi:hypothetical protein
MKKGLSIILLVTYFVVSTGFTVNLHYCMDKLQSWEFVATEKDKYDQCGMDKKENACCHDEVKVLMLQQDISKVQASAYNFSLPVLVSYTTSYLLLPFKNVNTTRLFFFHSPPLISKQDTYLDNCVFRI